MSVRVRYAPSPTGLQHIGGIRTALFNYFFARANGGSFVLRVEDTDRERSTPEALEDLFSTLEWLGIDYDEGPEKGGDFGPYVQSERRSIYIQKAEELVAAGKAYPCFCTPERLEALREQQKAAKSNIGYDRKCRSISPARAAGEQKHVIRLKLPLDGKTEFDDVLLGRRGRKNKDLSPDPIILKTDGFPTYHLANVVDDHMMGITHIMRAQEWISSGPLHRIIYEAFGWTPPRYCHLPMVMGKDGRKLSKRHGSTAVSEFRKAGYLPEAMLNFVSLLGWSYDDSREFFTKDDLCELFVLEKINKAPAVFDSRKLDWFNGHYIRMKDPVALKNELLTILGHDAVVSNPPEDREKKIFDGVFPVIRERLKLLNDISPMLRFLFSDTGTGEIEDAIPKKMDATGAIEALREGMALLVSAPPAPPTGDDEACRNWDEQRESEFRRKAEEMGWKIGGMLQPMRLAVTASRVSLPLFPAIRLLGVEEALRRARRLAEALEQHPPQTRSAKVGDAINSFNLDSVARSLLTLWEGSDILMTTNEEVADDCLDIAIEMEPETIDEINGCGGRSLLIRDRMITILRDEYQPVDDSEDDEDIEDVPLGDDAECQGRGRHKPFPLALKSVQMVV